MLHYNVVFFTVWPSTVPDFLLLTVILHTFLLNCQDFLFETCKGHLEGGKKPPVTSLWKIVSECLQCYGSSYQDAFTERTLSGIVKSNSFFLVRKVLDWTHFQQAFDFKLNKIKKLAFFFCQKKVLGILLFHFPLAFYLIPHKIWILSHFRNICSKLIYFFLHRFGMGVRGCCMGQQKYLNLKVKLHSKIFISLFLSGYF